nr:hypothetical protein [Sedimentibacter sp.]
MWKKLINKMKFSNTKKETPGNVYISDEYEAKERKEDVDANEK